MEYNNDELEKLYQQKQSDYREKYKNYFDIINGELSTIIGFSKDISLRCDDRAIDIILRNISIFTFRIENNFYILNIPFEKDFIIRLDNLDVFKSIVQQAIEQKIIPTIKDYYKKNFIKVLPSKMKDEKKIFNFEKITTNSLKEIFKEITGEWGNNEEIETVDIQNKNGLEINFSVDCGRYGLHRDNYIKINEKGFINVRMCEYLEGGDVEHHFKNKIEK